MWEKFTETIYCEMWTKLLLKFQFSLSLLLKPNGQVNWSSSSLNSTVFCLLASRGAQRIKGAEKESQDLQIKKPWGQMRRTGHRSSCKGDATSCQTECSSAALACIAGLFSRWEEVMLWRFRRRTTAIRWWTFRHPTRRPAPSRYVVPTAAEGPPTSSPTHQSYQWTTSECDSRSFLGALWTRSFKKKMTDGFL